MQLSVTFRHMEPSEPLKEYSQDKLVKLEKYLDAVLDAEVVMTIEKFRHRAEVLINSDGLKIKAEEETEDMYSAIDMVVDKLERQIKRHREKLKAHKSGTKKAVKGDGLEAFSEPEEYLEGSAERPGLDLVTKHHPKMMAVEEAAEALARAGENMVIFINAEDEHISILHQLRDGRLELIRIHH